MRSTEEIEAEARAAGLRGNRLSAWLLNQNERLTSAQIAARLAITGVAAHKSLGRARRAVHQHRVWQANLRETDEAEKARQPPPWAWQAGAELREAMRHNRPEEPNPLVGREGDTAHIGRGVHAQRLTLLDFALVCWWSGGGRGETEEESREDIAELMGNVTIKSRRVEVFR